MDRLLDDGTTLAERINAVLQSRHGSVVRIINDKLTLAMFSLLASNLSRVERIQFIMTLDPNDALFGQYDIIEKNQLRHFADARSMHDFIQKNVQVRRVRNPELIRGNVLLVDDDLMLAGSSSLELSPKYMHNARHSINFDAMVSGIEDKTQVQTARQKFERAWNDPVITDDFKEELLSRLRYVYMDHSPSFLYYFTLRDVFSDRLDTTLERLHEEVADPDEAQDSISLTDLNLNDYLFELSEYTKNHPDLAKAARGIYAVTDPSPSDANADSDVPAPRGAIFCFVHRGHNGKPESESALYPYYLIYLERDGTILHGNGGTRETLKRFRALCQGKDAPDADLVKAFLAETDEAAMSDKDRLDFMPGFTDIDVVYEIALRQNDIPLSSPVRPVPKAGKRTYIFADSILVCLEESIIPKLIDALADIQPTPNKFVLRDSAFEDDIALKDETLRRLQVLVARNTKDAKPTYVVDFI